MLRIGYYIFRFFCILFNRKHVVEHLGTNYGGWRIPKNDLSKLKHVISAGIGEDISFETDLIKVNTNVNIYLFDPTPPGFNHIKLFKEYNDFPERLLINSGKKKHPKDKTNQSYPKLEYEEIKRLMYYSLGLEELPTQLKLALPKSSEILSYSKEFVSDSDNYIICECLPVSKILTEHLNLNGADIDLIKMDIEGSEYGVVNDLIRHNIFPRLVIFEIHMFNLTNIWSAFTTLLKLISHGYRCYYMNGNDYGFIKK